MLLHPFWQGLVEATGPQADKGQIQCLSGVLKASVLATRSCVERTRGGLRQPRAIEGTMRSHPFAQHDGQRARLGKTNEREPQCFSRILQAAIPIPCSCVEIPMPGSLEPEAAQRPVLCEPLA